MVCPHFSGHMFITIILAFVSLHVCYVWPGKRRLSADSRKKGEKNLVRNTISLSATQDLVPMKPPRGTLHLSTVRVGCALFVS